MSSSLYFKSRFIFALLLTTILAPAAWPANFGFTPQTRLGFTTGDQWEPAISADGYGHVYVLYPQYVIVPGCPGCPLPTLILVVSNDNGNTWRKNYVAVAGLVTDRQWLVFDNGPTGNADDNTIFLFENDVLGQTVVSSPGSTGPTDAMGGLVWQQAVNRNSNINNGSPCGQARFDTISRIIYYPCVNGDRIEITKLHVDPSQRTGLTFTKVMTPASPGGSVGDIFPDLAIDSAGNSFRAVRKGRY